MAKKPSQETLKDCLLAAAKQAIDPHKGLCIAYSGGLDSTVMLHLSGLLKQQNASLNVTAFHVNHGISKHADKWLQHCQQQATLRNIPLHSSRLKLQKLAQKSLEAEARDARYQALSDFAKAEFIVFLAQHQDDQAETLLLQLKRGAGVKGLASMPLAYRNKQGTQFVRPLLGFSRQMLLDFALEESLLWIEDESNQDQTFDRNFIRQSIMPALTKRWPQFSATVTRSASHCASTQAVVNEYMDVISRQVLTNANTLNIPSFRSFSLPTQKEFLRYWLSDFVDLLPSSAQLNILIDMLANKSTQAAHIKLTTIIVEKSKNSLIIVTSPNEQPPNIDFDWQGDNALVINANLKVERVINAQKNSFWLPYGLCTVHFGSTHFTAKMQVNRPSKTLKVWYQEWSVSALQRRLVPVITHNNRMVALQLSQPTKTKVEHQYSVDNDISALGLLDGCWAQFVNN